MEIFGFKIPVKLGDLKARTEWTIAKNINRSRVGNGIWGGKKSMTWEKFRRKFGDCQNCTLPLTASSRVLVVLYYVATVEYDTVLHYIISMLHCRQAGPTDEQKARRDNVEMVDFPKIEAT